VLLVAAIGLASFTGFAVVVNQVPLFLERGLSTSTAAWALGLGGLGQVLGRLGYPVLTAWTGVRARTVLVIALMAATTGLLAVLPGPAALLIAAAMLAGATRGVGTLLQATAITDRWGPTHYGRLNGLLSAPVVVATAVAPWAGSALALVLGGYPPVFGVLAAVSIVAAAFAAGSMPRRQPDPSP
jgi:MFS family permease